MTQKNQDDITNAELAKLIETVAVNLAGFQEAVEQRFDKMEQRMERGFGETDERITKLEDTMVTKIYLDLRLEKIEAGIFTEGQKKSILDTVKLVNNQLEANVLGKESITLTRPEYDVIVDVVHLPNRFVTA